MRIVLDSVITTFHKSLLLWKKCSRTLLGVDCFDHMCGSSSEAVLLSFLRSSQVFPELSVRADMLNWMFDVTSLQVKCNLAWRKFLLSALMVLPLSSLYIWANTCQSWGFTAFVCQCFCLLTWSWVPFSSCDHVICRNPSGDLNIWGNEQPNFYQMLLSSSLNHRLCLDIVA